MDALLSWPKTNLAIAFLSLILSRPQARLSDVWSENIVHRHALGSPEMEGPHKSLG
jgi:hypothetical protein